MDLWIAMGFIAAISVLAYLAGRRLTLSDERNRSILFAECLAFSLVFAFGLSGQLAWANAFPTSAALCWSNWMPIFLSFAAGLASGVPALRDRLRRAVSVTMALLAFGFLLDPVIRPQLFPIPIGDVGIWKEGICLQSHEASCGPAAAATLLHQTALLTPTRLRDGGGQWAVSPLNSAEKLMAHACLTSSQGTSALGLIRGLRIAVAGSTRIVDVADSDPGLWVARMQLPNVAVVRFQDDRAAGPVRKLLGTEGEGHAVVVHSRTDNGRWRVADPAVGWQLWDDEPFRRVFTGEAIYLEPR
jgi:hypothetical protein